MVDDNGSENVDDCVRADDRVRVILLASPSKHWMRLEYST